MRIALPVLTATIAAFLAGSFAFVSLAEAKPRKHVPVRALTVNRRPFTDMGNVVTVGSESRYVGDVHRYSGSLGTPGIGPSYGSEILPGRFDMPGARPLFNF